MRIPTDPFEAAIFGINFVVNALSLEDAYKRLASGISAKAQAEDRNVTEEEEAMLDLILEAEKRRLAGG